MSRVVKDPDVRRQELIEIAMRQFMENGYEKTSIRSIVKAAGGEIGMFYHYFSSKEEIFTDALKHYNATYISDLKALVKRESDADFLELMDKILAHLFTTLPSYGDMQLKKVDIALLAVLHQNSMLALHPILMQILMVYIARNRIKQPEIELCLLVDFLLFGISGIIHDQKVTDIQKKCESIKEILSKQLDIGYSG